MRQAEAGTEEAKEGRRAQREGEEGKRRERKQMVMRWMDGGREVEGERGRGMALQGVGK